MIKCKSSIFVVILLTVLLITPYFSQAQSEAEKPKIKIKGSVAWVSQQYWRGIGRGKAYGDAPAFKSYLTFNANNLDFGVVASASFDNIYKSVIPWVQYSPNKNFTVGMWDIYSGGTDFWETDYFNFDPQESKHLVDLFVSYKSDKFPIKLLWGTLVAGGDDDKEGNQKFSSYCEVSYLYNVNSYAFGAALGVTPWEGIYGKDPGIVNASLQLQRTFLVNKNTLPLPLFTRVTYNEVKDQFHFIAGALLVFSLN